MSIWDRCDSLEFGQINETDSTLCLLFVFSYFFGNEKNFTFMWSLLMVENVKSV